MPKMGESISEATIISWLKNVGDSVEEDETILEVATDKVDNEIPSPTKGVIKDLLFMPNEIIQVGQVIALIETEHTSIVNKTKEASSINTVINNTRKNIESDRRKINIKGLKNENSGTHRDFLSPLVINIAKKENLTIEEIRFISGTGTGGRVTKSDLVKYIKNKPYPLPSKPQQQNAISKSTYLPPLFRM